MVLRREFLKSVCACSALSNVPDFLNSYGHEHRSKPNIVFFFVDDMGWQDASLPFYHERTVLNQRYYTPNMERMAEEGKKFTQAYACAVCSPSRVSLMTGLNSARHRVTNWTLRKDKSPDQPHPDITPPQWNLNGLSPSPDVNQTIYAKTLPALLKENGYRTIHVGKAHFGAKETQGEDPLNLGFDVNIAGHAAGGPGSYHGTNNFSAAWRNGDRIWDVPGLEKYHGRQINLTEALTREANLAIDKAVADKKPFYLYMSHYAIHAPWEKDHRFYDKYIREGLNEFDAVYASMIEGMDASLGSIRKNLQRHGIENDTVLVFMSDNGAPSQAERNHPLRGHKLTPYEGGVRVPLIVKWPGVVVANSSCSDPVMIEDIFPTFLEIAGAENAAQIGGKIDGVSFTPLLCNQPGFPKERAIFWHFPHNYGQTPYSSVRQGDWKLIYHHIDRKLELFNLDDDLGEVNDLSAVCPAKLKEVVNILHDYLLKVKAQMPIDNKINQPIEYPRI